VYIVVHGVYSWSLQYHAHTKCATTKLFFLVTTNFLVESQQVTDLRKQKRNPPECIVRRLGKRRLLLLLLLKMKAGVTSRPAVEADLSAGQLN